MTHLGVSEAEAHSLIKLSVTLAREAREEYMKENPGSAVPLIAGSVGPFGREDFIGYTYNGKYVDKVTAQVCMYSESCGASVACSCVCDVGCCHAYGNCK